MFIKLNKVLKKYLKKQDSAKENKEFIKIKSWWEKTQKQENNHTTFITQFKINSS